MSALNNIVTGIGDQYWRINESSPLHRDRDPAGLISFEPGINLRTFLVLTIRANDKIHLICHSEAEVKRGGKRLLVRMCYII